MASPKKARKIFAVLGSEEFHTKASVVERCRTLLNGAELRKPFKGKDHEFLSDLLPRHPAADEKIGCGAEWFEVRLHYWRGAFRQRGFYVVRTDGSSVDFSFYVCLLSDPADRRRCLVEACREAVGDSIHRFKLATFMGRDSIPCAETGERVGWDEAHVDHADPWPFRNIVQEWLKLQPSDPVTSEVGMRRIFVEGAVRGDFCRFHDKVAVLRVVHRDVNLRTPRPDLRGARCDTPIIIGG